MAEYTIAFAGKKVAIRYDNDEVHHFLSFLFADVHCPDNEKEENYEETLIIAPLDNGENEEYTLADNKEVHCTGRLGVHFAAILFDQVIFNLLNNSSNGVAIHSGAVAYQNKVILLPGQSGSGKSNISAWLTANNFSYLTDELVFLPDDESNQAVPFTRPFCIKSGALSAIKKIIPKDNLHPLLEDEQGAVVAHRSLNPVFSIISSSPALILFPSYLADAPLSIEKISGAQASFLLMACDVNARNLTDHGFKQIVQISRLIPAYRVTYSSFKGFKDALADLFAELNWN